MAGYHIDNQVLVDVLRALDQGGTAVTAGGASLRDAATGGLGTPALDGAAGDLLAGWTGTFTAISDAVANTSAGVDRCLALYTENEEHIANLLRGIGGPA